VDVGGGGGLDMGDRTGVADPPLAGIDPEAGVPVPSASPGPGRSAAPVNWAAIGRPPSCAEAAEVGRRKAIAATAIRMERFMA
jgi:hypothetical protein